MKPSWKLTSNLFCLLVALVVSFGCKQNTEIEVKSPNGKNILTFYPLSEAQNGITFSVQNNGRKVILPSVLELKSNDIDFSSPFEIKSVENSVVENEWINDFGERKITPDNYTQVKIQLESAAARVNLICRAYNEGVAFAYEIPEQSDLKSIRLDDEVINYQFADDHEVWSTPKREPGVLTAQGEYQKIPLSNLQEGCERPLVIEIADDIKIALAEAKLVNYARLSYSSGKDGKFSITSSLDGKLQELKQDTITGALEGQWTQHSKVTMELPFQSPWRVVMMAEDHGKLLEHNYLLQNLNDSCAIKDVSWITPGKVLREGTLTTKGGFAAIDFVASHNMQYVHFDAGWYGNEMYDGSDATTITLDPNRSKGPFDIEAICKYAKAKGVKVMLYVNRRALEKQLDEVLPLYKKWGIAGIKYGFVRVGDQDATAWLHEAIKKTAEYEMIMDVHDEYRPTGFSRTYPNLMTQEGIAGDETTVTNAHTLITMFTRTLAGASDNTVCYYNKRVEKMGSHASQLAKTVCIFSPLQFLYWYDSAPMAPIKKDALWGNTKHIGNEPELEFFNNVPTVWDETKVLHAEIGELGVIARRKGNDWFVGCINGEASKNVKVNFSFLEEGTNYSAKIYTDDETVNTRTRVKIQEKQLNAKDSVNLKVKANNGFAMHIQLVK